MMSHVAQQREGFVKVQHFCKRCALDGLPFAWMDTCCIDKSSSAELSEAINSMYKWYQNAARCYAYIHDYDIDTEHSKLSKSLWFKRGWTLQELIAPSDVHFYDRTWLFIGTKQSFSSDLAATTKIPQDVLLGQDIRDYSVAQRMSWAAERKTTRVEDQAYSLMGLFSVNMPMLYGEGDKAFIRLQEEIMRYSSDHSIFAWPGIISVFERAELYDVAYRRMEGLLAKSPEAFTFCGKTSDSSSRTGLL